MVHFHQAVRGRIKQGQAALFLLVSQLWLSPQVLADSLPPPLLLQGFSSAGEYIELELSRSELEKLPQNQITTALPWIPKKSTFKGVRLKTLLNHFHVSGKQFTLSALNDYSVTLSRHYIDKYDPLLAITQDGNYMKVRNYGPYWLVMSIDTHPEVAERHHLAKMIWQLTTIEAH